MTSPTSALATFWPNLCQRRKFGPKVAKAGVELTYLAVLEKIFFS